MHAQNKGTLGPVVRENVVVNPETADIGKSTGPRSSTGENSGGPMKTLIVPVLLSGKKKSCREPLYGNSYVEKKLGPVKVLEDQ